MKLIRVNHLRCDDIEERIFYVLEKDLSQDEIEDLIHKAQDSYLKKCTEAKNRVPNKVEYPKPFDQQTDDLLTVGQLKVQLKDYREYQKALFEANNTVSFHDELVKLGFRSLSDYIDFDHENSFILDWGHRHGEKIKYI